jgi:fructokinase
MIVAIGELLADCITTDFVEDLSKAKTFTIIQGGSPANVAANLHWLGNEVALVSCVGNDGIGKMLIESVQKTGLDITHIEVDEDLPTSLVMVSRSKGTPDFIPYRMADRMIGYVNDKLLKKATIIHSCAFALSKEPASTSILDAFFYADANKKIISIDWNFAPSVWGADNGKQLFRIILKFNPLLKCSIDDIERFCGKPMNVVEAKTFLDQYTSQLICLTLGSGGVWYKGSDNNWFFLPADAVDDVKDTTGAGDAFWSGVLSSYLKTKDLHVCVREGLRVAALKVSKFGPLYA